MSRSLLTGHQDRIIFVFSYQVQILAPRRQKSPQIFGYDSVYTLTSNKVDIFSHNNRYILFSIQLFEAVRQEKTCCACKIEVKLRELN